MISAASALVARCATGAVCLLIGILSFAAAQPARADHQIWSGLVLATQAEKPKPTPAELEKFGSKIQRFFGYNQLELIGSATKTMDEEVEKWLVPSPNFWVCAKARRAEGKAYDLKLSIFQDKRCLVETKAKLGSNSPLLIRGPMHERGQLILVLQVIP